MFLIFLKIGNQEGSVNEIPAIGRELEALGTRGNFCRFSLDISLNVLKCSGLRILSVGPTRRIPS